MAKYCCSSLHLSIFYLFIVFLFSTSGGILRQANAQAEGQGAWCIPKPSASEQELLDNINYACGLVDCSPIQQGGPCFNPSNSMNHASVAMNLYYQQQGRNAYNCDFKNSGLVTVTDPSYCDCKFEYKQ